jgi:excisionase family DNA binding protein
MRRPRTVVGRLVACGSVSRPSGLDAVWAAPVGVSRASIRRRIASGEIRRKKVGSRYRIPVQEVEQFGRSFVREMATTPSGGSHRHRAAGLGNSTLVVRSRPTYASSHANTPPMYCSSWSR